MADATLILLHLLILVYWLGGDLGAFLASFLIGDPDRERAARLAAAGLLGDIDMAPRTALILAFPTGYTLAVTRGWIELDPVWLGLVWIGTGVWLALAWRIHLAHAGADGARRIDLGIRWTAAIALSGASGLALLGVVVMPLFIALKLILLAACILIGLLVRRLTADLGPALKALAVGEADADRRISRSLAATRPAVVSLWLLLVVAAILGVWKPA